MMCQSIGLPPISTIGFGRYSVSSRMRVPRPPQSSTTFGRRGGTGAISHDDRQRTAVLKLSAAQTMTGGKRPMAPTADQILVLVAEYARERHAARGFDPSNPSVP